MSASTSGWNCPAEAVILAEPRALSDYYGDSWVRRRIREYCGETSVYLTALRHAHAGWDHAERVPPDALDDLLGEGADVARSMWDRSSVLIHLDLDYQNIDFGGAPFRHPVEMFTMLEPVYRATLRVLDRFGLPLMALITGRGYHFTGSVPLDSPVTDRLASIASETPAWFSTLPERCPPWIAAEMTARHARAFIGAGLIAEFLAHRILRRARRRAPIPIVLNGTVVGGGPKGRECLSIDVSYAGDPLDARHLRVAFGSYQKHLATPGVATLPGSLAPLAAVPRGDESLPDLISRQRGLRHAVRAARRRPATIPVVSAGVDRLLDAYVASDLAAFHRGFYGTPPAESGWFEALVESRLWRSLPECVIGPLVEPNDRLLQPAVIQHVTRALMAEGIAPRTIAGAIQSRYATDFNWGRRWFWLDARSRAEFDVRIFAGLLLTGLDRGVDFNCRSAQEKDVCPRRPCGWDLRVTREQLLGSSAR
jgi:hypothetical protein